MTLCKIGFFFDEIVFERIGMATSAWIQNHVVAEVVLAGLVLGGNGNVVGWVWLIVVGGRQ